MIPGVLSIVTWLIDKISAPVAHRLRHPDLHVESLEPAGSSMTNPSKVYVNIVLTIRNAGRATASSFRGVARTAYGDGIRLTLRDPRNPGDATVRREGGDDVIEWQSAEPWPESHTRRIECRVHMREGARVPIALRLMAPYMKPVFYEVEVTWPGSSPALRLVPLSADDPTPRGT